MAYKDENYMMPFLWVHGETEATYRKMVKAVDEANCKAFCVEARPHEGFCQASWWRDMDILLDEAEKRGMRVWILDDKHFPTGFAAGGALRAPNRLRRQSICYRSVRLNSGKVLRLNVKKYVKPKPKYDMFGMICDKMAGNSKITFDDDRLFSCSAYSGDERVLLDPFVRDGVLEWTVPEGEWTLELTFLTRNIGMRRSYINMMEPESCRIQIDEVYEKHYEHYKEKFGTVIAGFFSDEPELGNSYYFNRKNRLGEDPELDLCWSESLERELEAEWGADYRLYLPLLWKNGCDPDLTAKMRFVYMDCVTRLVETSFSKQIGEWCRSHGVEYIGHVIEDADLHCRTGCGLGHYFRGIKYQSMAGVDCIGGQTEPQGEDASEKYQMFFKKNGEFNHYALAKMAFSQACINPVMRGRSMCEIFGNYGWQEGVRTEKYLIDHFMVRGVNHFVPHAFTCKEYPDKDCPPHFYAMGNNPQYRHFGALMGYANRVCALISDGRADARAAVLYHGESEWTGETMLMQKPARELYDNNVDFLFLPSDVFSEREFYGTEIGRTIRCGQAEIRLLLIPGAERITKACADGIAEFLAAGGSAAFVGRKPDGTCTGEPLPDLSGADCIPLSSVGAYAKEMGLAQIHTAPATDRLRCLHYYGGKEFWYLFNESDKTFAGTVRIPGEKNLCLYNAWEDVFLAADVKNTGEETEVKVEIGPSGSLFLVADPDAAPAEARPLPERKIPITNFTRSVCLAADYPDFAQRREISGLEGYEETDRKFSGIIRYETEIEIGSPRAVLVITEAYEGVEVFVNGKSCGIQVVPEFTYDLTDYVRPGRNALAIEVATTLERERTGKSRFPTGITGEVTLYVG